MIETFEYVPHLIITSTNIFKVSFNIIRED